MDNIHEQGLAWARFQALRSNQPDRWDETEVARFHDIVTALEGAYGVDLSSFRIAASEVKPMIVAAWRQPRSGRLGRPPQYSSKRYCDEKFVQRQMDGIVLYFQNMQPQSARPKVGF